MIAEFLFQLKESLTMFYFMYLGIFSSISEIAFLIFNNYYDNS
jgi:hypothetical protein